MKPKIIHTTRIVTTPAQLRVLATYLEDLWGKLKLGEVIPTHTIHGPDCEVQFMLDQDEWHREERERQRRGGK